jgi:hypothetical protein
MHAYEVRPPKDHRGVDLISDVLPFGRLWYGEPNAISDAKFRSRSHDAVIRVYDAAGNVVGTHKHAGDFKEPCASTTTSLVSNEIIEGQSASLHPVRRGGFWRPC